MHPVVHPVVHLVPTSLSPRAHLPHTPRAAPLRSDEELRRAGRIIKNHMETRFTQIRKAFRTMDEDKTGTVSREELKQVLMDMNLAISPEVVTALIDLADVDGDGAHPPASRCLPPAAPAVR